jgi:tRNA A37 threonylcarbamoyladenosine dehydratase
MKQRLSDWAAALFVCVVGWGLVGWFCAVALEKMGAL